MSPIRNINAIGRTKPIPIYHAIPPPSSAIYKVTIDDGTTETDVSDLIVSGIFNGGTTKTIGNFELKIIDPAKTIYNLISKFNDVYFYGDYGASATTKRLRYKIESKGYDNHNTIISGLGILMKFAGKTIIYKTVDANNNLTTKAKSTILTEIIQENFPDISDFTNIETNSDEVQKNYSEIPFMDIINDICESTHEFYLDYDLAPHYFTKGSITNTSDAISEEVNYLYANDNIDDAEEIFSKVRVYGSTIEGVQIIATSEEDTSLTGGIKKDKIITNTSITTITQAQQLADAEFEKIRNPVRIGAFNSLLLPGLNPGEKLFIALPQEDISPGYYQIQEFTHEFDLSVPNAFRTKVIMVKRRINLPKIIESINEFTSESTDKENPNDMDFSQIITFESTSGTHSDTEVDGGYLKVDEGKSVGTWLSDIYTFSSDLSSIEFRWSGESLITDTSATTSQLLYSVDGGITFTPNLTQEEVISITEGTKLQIKFLLRDPLAKVKSIAFLYTL